MSLTQFAILLYILISVQSVDNTDTNIVSENSKINEALWSKNQNFNTFLNKNDFHTDDLLMAESKNSNIMEDLSNGGTLQQLKSVLSKILKKSKVNKRELSARLGKRHKVMKHEDKRTKNESQWERWTTWSPCSVTCGKGRHIRWRNCKENCVDGVETEMQEKSCQLPACPQKLFGLIKI